MVLQIRLKKLQQEIKAQNLGAALISKVADIVYLTGYSGFSSDEREAYILTTGSEQFIFTDGRYSTAVKNLIPDFELVEIDSSNKFQDLLLVKVKELKIKKLGVDENDLRVSEYNLIKKTSKNLKKFKFHEHRAIKTKEEVNLIENACRIGDQAFNYILKKIRTGISETQLAYFLENFIREKGFEPSFKTIAAFGENSAIPHHKTGERKLKQGDLILLDFGVKFKNYCSDMTRTVVFSKASEEQVRMHRAAREAQEKAIQYLEKNKNKEIKASDVDKIAGDWIIRQGYPSIPHSIGHGIGIEVHEHPYLSANGKDLLRDGMVFSIEPGIYISGFGGVRIEDLFVFEKGLRQITKSEKGLQVV